MSGGGGVWGSYNRGPRVPVVRPTATCATWVLVVLPPPVSGTKVPCFSDTGSLRRPTYVSWARRPSRTGSGPCRCSVFGDLRTGHVSGPVGGRRV